MNSIKNYLDQTTETVARASMRCALSGEDPALHTVLANYRKIISIFTDGQQCIHNPYDHGTENYYLWKAGNEYKAYQNYKGLSS